MKNKKILLLLLIINIILIGIILNLITRNTIIPKEKHILKEMTETEYDNSINSLNKSHTDYSNYIQTCKSNLAAAITTAGVATDSNATFETITTNVSQILSTKTNDATATANDILSEKTAYVKGSKITGTIPNNGELNWNPTTSTTYTVPAGYYSGGVLNSKNAYDKGLSDGKSSIQPLTLSGTFSTAGSATSGGWGRSISVWTSGTILQATYNNYNTLTINSRSGCTITFQNHVLTISVSISGSNSQSEVPDGTVSASTSGSYNITLS